MISGCSTLDSLKQSYENVLPPSSDKTYAVKPGDSIWSIAINFNLDAELLIQNNNLEKPYTIYPNQELRLLTGRACQKQLQKNHLQLMNWHHPLGENPTIPVNDESWLIFQGV